MFIYIYIYNVYIYVCVCVCMYICPIIDQNMNPFISADNQLIQLIGGALRIKLK